MIIWGIHSVNILSSNILFCSHLIEKFKTDHLAADKINKINSRIFYGQKIQRKTCLISSRLVIKIQHNKGIWSNVLTGLIKEPRYIWDSKYAEDKTA